MSTRAIRVILLVTGLCVLVLAQPASVARDVQPQPDSDRFREELVEFFADLGQYSPTVLGGLSDKAQSLEAIRERVERLSPEELASLEKVFSLVPDWRMVPEAMAASLPPETRQGLQPATDHAIEQVLELRALREKLGNVYTLARLLPPETLERLELDQASVAVAQANLNRMTAQRLGWLEQRLGADEGWQAFATKVPESLPEEIRKGSLALAQKGHLESAEIDELVQLRRELDTFLADAKRLPPDIRQRLDLTAINQLRQKLGATTPEMLFVLREEIDPTGLRKTMRQVGRLAGLESIDATGRAELEAFRGELSGTLAVPTDSARGVENLGVLYSWISERTEAELLLVRERIEQVPDWRRTMPVLLEASASPGITWMIENLRQGSFDSELLEDLLFFRDQLSSRFTELQSSGTMAPERAAAAARSLEKTDIIRLAVMRDAYFRQVQGQAPVVADGMLVDLQVAVDVLAPEVFVASGLLIPGNCSIPSVGTIGGQCVGIPLCDFCPEVCFPQLTLPGLDLGIVCAAFAPLENAINAASSTVNAIGDVINGIFNTVVDVANTVAGLADPVVQGLISALEAVIQASGLDDFLDPANLAGLLGIVGNYWESIPNVPTLPCPPDGFNIPLFGTVGEAETTLSYTRYKWIFDKILEIIPKSEEALPISITNQILYAGAEYLGLCLEAASDMRDDVETVDFRSTVETDLIGIINSMVSVESDAGILQSSVNAYGAATTSALAGLDTDVDSARNTAAQIASQLTDLQNVLLVGMADVEDDAVRRRIEASLLTGEDGRISTFQLPSAFGGLLEVVRQIVLESIQNALDAGFDVTSAQAEFALADAAVSATDYRTAYERFGTAYRRATRGYQLPVREEYVGDLDGNGLEDLVVNFGKGPGLGIYIYFNGTTWVRLHGLGPEEMLIGDLDGNGSDELIVDFGSGSGLGLYVYYNRTNWVRLNGLSPEGIFVGDLDGNGKDELIVDFGNGPGLGLYIYYNATNWFRLHGTSPLGVFAGDLDGNGLDELVVDFGPGGLYAYFNNSMWVGLFGTKSALLASGDLDDASITSALQDALQEALQTTHGGTAPPADPFPEDSGRSAPPEPRPEELGLTSPPEPLPGAAVRRILGTR